MTVFVVVHQLRTLDDAACSVVSVSDTCTAKCSIDVTSSFFAGYAELQSRGSGIAGIVCRTANEKIQCMLKVNCIEYPAHHSLLRGRIGSSTPQHALSVFGGCIMAQSRHHGQQRAQHTAKSSTRLEYWCVMTRIRRVVMPFQDWAWGLQRLS